MNGMPTTKKSMTNEEKALIILEALDKNLFIDWNLESFYISAIIEGLEEIDEKEEK